MAEDYAQFQRIERALRQRIYVIGRSNAVNPAEWNILGTTDTMYNVTIDERNVMQIERHRCSCMDFMRRRQPCKHIYCTLFRVYRCSKQELIARTNVDDVLVAVDQYEHERPPPPESYRPGEPRFADHRVVVEPPIELRVEVVPKNNETCAICYEDFLEAPDPTSLCGTCGNQIHTDCIGVWLKKAKSCPLCRAPWSAKRPTK